MTDRKRQATTVLLVGLIVAATTFIVRETFFRQDDHRLFQLGHRDLSR